MLNTSFPKVQTKKEYMDFMGSLMSKAEEEIDHERGRPRQLKSFIIESNSQVPTEFNAGSVSGVIQPTGVQDISVVQLSKGNKTAPFFLDTSDKRFWVLHTNALSDVAQKIVGYLVRSRNYEFDHAWFSSNMLSDISAMQGNTYNGFRTTYNDLFFEEDEEVPVEELMINIAGRSSSKALAAIRSESDLQNALAFSRIRVVRGKKPIFSEDDISFSGFFVVKGGTSIDDHISLVDHSKKLYNEKIREVEDFRIGVKTVDDRTLVEGKAFDFEFKRNIDDLGMFIERIMSPRFRIWGIKSKITNSHYQFLAVDLHTGDPFDVELSNNLMRVYLPKGSCGNVVLRLLVNLQHFFDSNTSCEELDLYGANV